MNAGSSESGVGQGDLRGNRRSRHAREPPPDFACPGNLERQKRFTTIAEDPTVTRYLCSQRSKRILHGPVRRGAPLPGGYTAWLAGRVWWRMYHLQPFGVAQLPQRSLCRSVWRLEEHRFLDGPQSAQRLALSLTAPRSRSTSRSGGAPKSRLYSRLKCEVSS